MPDWTYTVSVHFIDDTDNENPLLIQQRLAEHGDLADPNFRKILHWHLDEILQNFQAQYTGTE